MTTALWLFYLGPFLTWLPSGAFGLAILGGAFFYFRALKGRAPSLDRTLYRLSAAVFLFRAGYAALLTVTQYAVWTGSEVTRALLNHPVATGVPLPWHLRPFSPLWESRLGYFALYSYGRFWVGAVFITLAVSAGFWLVLRMLRRFRPRALSSPDVAAGLLGALIAGWPGFVVFVPLAFLFSAALLVFFRLTGRSGPADMTGPFLAATALTLIFGPYLINLLGLGVLRI